jgi:hypothetical protein
MSVKMRTIKSLLKKNSFVRRNIVLFFTLIVLANTFLSCTKYETVVNEVKIVNIRVSEIGHTHAKLTIVIAGDNWILDNCGFEIQGYWNNLLSYSYEETEYSEDFEAMVYLVHFVIDGLLPGRTYQWRPYIEADDVTVYGEYLVFSTLF